MTDGICGATSARRRDIDEETTTPNRPYCAAATPAAPATTPSAAQDRAVAQYARLASPAPAGDDVLYVGMNGESAGAEAAALRASGVRVTTIDHGGADDTVRAGGGRHRLTLPDGPLVAVPGKADAAGIASFVATLGLDPATAREVEGVLARARPGERAELAGIAKTWAQAERGARAPARLVLSGHSGSGDNVYDGRTTWGSLSFEGVRALARAMPRAAAQVEDLHLSACSTSGNLAVPSRRDEWLAAFPNLKTMWGYDGAASGTVPHLAAWARATSGRADRLGHSPALAAQNVVVWSRAAGYGGPLGDLTARAAAADARFAAFASGAERVRASHEPTVDGDYRVYRALASRPDVADAARREYARRADQLLRVRYFEEGVRRRFAAEHGPTIEAAYRAIGRTPPDFARLSLAETAREVEAASRAMWGRQDSAEALRGRALLVKYARLDRATIPDSWCVH